MIIENKTKLSKLSEIFEVNLQDFVSYAKNKVFLHKRYLSSSFIFISKIHYNMSQIVKPYQKEGSKKEQVGKMFDNIAPYYDFLNRLLTLRIDVLWRRKAIATIKNRKAKHILDVATGTADLTVEINKQLKPEQIIGMDLSKEMLEIGRKKIAKRGLNNLIRLDQGDSENLTYDDNSFDVATAAFGVRNFENLKAGLTEMHRVLKTNGQIVILEFSRPTIFPFKQLFNLYFISSVSFEPNK